MEDLWGIYSKHNSSLTPHGHQAIQWRLRLESDFMLAYGHIVYFKWFGPFGIFFVG